MDFYYIVIKIGSDYFGAIKVKDEFDMQNEIENIMQHASIGNTVIICDDLETAAELFNIQIVDIEEL